MLVEFELLVSLEEKEKKIRLKLKYMEDYCSGRYWLLVSELSVDLEERKMLRWEIMMKDRE